MFKSARWLMGALQMDVGTRIFRRSLSFVGGVVLSAPVPSSERLCGIGAARARQQHRSRFRPVWDSLINKFLLIQDNLLINIKVSWDSVDSIQIQLI